MLLPPMRLQLRRRKGYKLQTHSQMCNGRDAVNVARPGKWGNPYRIGTCLIPDARAAVEAFEANLPLTDFSELRGKNLACWCNPAQPCHADVLLRIANR